MTETNLLTGIRDIDREIVNKLNDRDLLQMCSLNRTYSQRVCDDDYFRMRTENGFPETVPYKDYVNTNKTRTVRTWKNHYLTIIKYIDLLEKNYEYIYKKLDKSPELLYLARKEVANNITYTKDEALMRASFNGHLPVVKYLVENVVNLNTQYRPLLRASFNGHLQIVKYLVEHGANISSLDDGALRLARANGNLSIVKYLLENGANINALDEV